MRISFMPLEKIDAFVFKIGLYFDWTKQWFAADSECRYVCGCCAIELFANESHNHFVITAGHQFKTGISKCRFVRW